MTDTPMFNFWFVLLDKENDWQEKDKDLKNKTDGTAWKPL